MNYESQPLTNRPSIRLSANFPGGVLPEVFGIITAADPQELRGERGLPGTILADALRIKGWKHYPAEVTLPGSGERLVSFAIIENLAKIERLARDFIRPQIFWVQRGEVIQVSTGGKSPQRLGTWDQFTAQPAATLHGSGNLALADFPATAFLCSTQCPAEKVVEAFDWARRQCDKCGAVISGFHTPVEKDVLAILARRGANIIWVPGRDLPQSIDTIFKTPMDEGRLLILSPFSFGKPSRSSKASCSERNRFVLARAAEHFIPHIAINSALAADLNSLPP